MPFPKPSPTGPNLSPEQQRLRTKEKLEEFLDYMFGRGLKVRVYVHFVCYDPRVNGRRLIRVPLKRGVQAHVSNRKELAMLVKKMRRLADEFVDEGV